MFLKRQTRGFFRAVADKKFGVGDGDVPPLIPLVNIQFAGVGAKPIQIVPELIYAARHCRTNWNSIARGDRYSSKHNSMVLACLKAGQHEIKT